MTNTKPPCDHYWFYPHTIWQGAGKNAVAVMRYCSKCETAQCAEAKNWRPIPPSYVDMREAADKALVDAWAKKRVGG